MDYGKFIDSPTSEESVQSQPNVVQTTSPNEVNLSNYRQTDSSPEYPPASDSIGEDLVRSGKKVLQAGAYPFQVAGGLLQGFANFAIGGTNSTIQATASTFLPFLYGKEDQTLWASEHAGWENTADTWVKNYKAFSDAAVEHPLFKPETLGKGSEDIQGMLGAFLHWTDDQTTELQQALEKRAESQQELNGDIMGTKQAAAATKVIATGLGLLVPYFGKGVGDLVKGKLDLIKEAQNVGNAKELAANISAKQAAQGPQDNLISTSPNWKDYLLNPESSNLGATNRTVLNERGMTWDPNVSKEQASGPRPGPTPSADQITTIMKDGVPTMVFGQYPFMKRFANEHGLDLATDAGKEAATSAWHEYANEVTKSAYPDAYIAFEMKASGLDALNKKFDGQGRQAYLNRIFDARNTDNIYGYRNSFTLDGENFEFKDYLTYTPAEFMDVVHTTRRKTINVMKDIIKEANPEEVLKRNQAGYVDYINQKSEALGLEPLGTHQTPYEAAVARAFELREMEVQNLKIAQEELAWKERYFESELEPLEQKINDSLQNPYKGREGIIDDNATSLKGVRPSKEGANYSSEQVQDYFESNAAMDIAEAHINDLISKATTPVGEDYIPFKKGRPGGKQSGAIDPSIFEDVGKKAVEGIKKATDAKETVRAIKESVGRVSPGEAGYVPARDDKSRLFSNEKRPKVNLFFRDRKANKFLGVKAGFLDSSTATALSLTNATQWLQGAAERSPTLRRVLDSFDNRVEGAGRNEITPYSETFKVRNAKFTEGLKTALAPLKPGATLFNSGKGKFGGLTKIQNDTLNKVLRGVIPLDKAPAQYRQAAINIRKLLDDHYNEMVATNVPGLSDKIGYLNNYFPRSYNLKGKFNMEKAWMDMAERNKLDPEVAREIFDNLSTDDRLYRVEPKDINSFLNDTADSHKKSFIDYERGLRRIPDSELLPFLDDNVFATLSKYGEEWSHRLTHAERFGANMEKLRADILSMGSEFKLAGTPMPKYAAEHIYNVALALDHNFKQIKDVDMRAIQSGVQTALNISLLPLSTLSSATEILMPMGTAGVYNFAKTVPSSLGFIASKIARRIYKDVPVGLREQLFNDTGIALESAKSYAESSMNRGFTSNKIDDAWFKMIGMHHFTKFTKFNAVNNFITMTKSMMKAAQDEKTMAAWMKKGGFTAAKATKLTEFMDYYGLDSVKGKDWIAKGMPREHEFYPQMVRGALRFAEDAVLTPNPATVPLWHSNPHLSLIKHLKTYQALMFTKVMRRAARNAARQSWQYNLLNGPKVLATATAMTGVGYLINQLYDYFNYGDSPPPFEKTPIKETMRAFDRVGFWGPGSPLWDSLSGASKLGVAGMIAPVTSIGIEGAIAMAKWQTQGDSNSLAKFMAMRASIFGRFKETREPLQKTIKQGLDTIKEPKSNKDWRF